MSPSPVWSHFVRFISEDDQELCGEPENTDIDIGLALAKNEAVTVKVLNVSSALEDGEFTGKIAKIKKLLSPLKSTEIGTIRCVGMNYKDHVAELKGTIPTVPEIFMKPSTALTGPCDPIVLPLTAPSAVDAEVELTVVIGKDCKNVKAESALDYVLGYTIANDLTCRDVQTKISQWGYCKSYDSFCPIGPALVSSQAITDPSTLLLKSFLDGKILQDSKTSEMIFSVAEIIEHLSKGTTLPKGTLILTGTPSGIGHGRAVPLYLKENAELRVGISKIGTLTNPIVAET